MSDQIEQIAHHLGRDIGRGNEDIEHACRVALWASHGGCATWRKKQVPGKTVCYNAICFGISGFHAPRIFMYTAQLFGDTVDVASRMESTGIPSMIQVSQDTANALIARARGKGSWRTPREDKIVAKGNGEMQTYFCGL